MGNKLTIIEQREVDFYSDQITTIVAENEAGTRVVFVPIRPICDLLGIAGNSQLRRVRRDAVLSETCTAVTVVHSIQ